MTSNAWRNASNIPLFDNFRAILAFRLARLVSHRDELRRCSRWLDQLTLCSRAAKARGCGECRKRWSLIRSQMSMLKNKEAD